jgi:hypothetical protein
MRTHRPDVSRAKSGATSEMAVDRMGYAGRLNLCRPVFDIPLIDYNRPSYGLLIGSGAGTMMAIMDASVRFRFALDLDDCRGREHKLCAFLRALDRNGLIDLVALAGWFSITDPKPIAAALKGLSAPVIIYSGAGLAREVFGDLPLVDTLDDFLVRAKQAELPPTPKLHVRENCAAASRMGAHTTNCPERPRDRPEKRRCASRRSTHPRARSRCYGAARTRRRGLNSTLIPSGQGRGARPKTCL